MFVYKDKTAAVVLFFISGSVRVVAGIQNLGLRFM
jgi:hypothetical protein